MSGVESEALDALLSGLGSMVLGVDRARRLVWQSGAMIEQGLGPEHSGLRLDALPSPFRELDGRVSGALDAGTPSLGHPLQLPDGEPVTADISPFAGGAWIRFRPALAVDEVRQRLEDDARRYRTLFGRVALGLAVVSLDGRWLRFNDYLLQLLGYPQEELRGRRFREITHPEDQGPYVERFEALLREEVDSFEMEKRYLRRDGRHLWVRLTMTCVRDDEGVPLHLLALIEDVGERRELSAALAESETRLRAAARVARVGTFEWNIQTNENVWTREMEQLYGLEEGTFEGTYEGWASRVHPEDLPEAQRRLSSALEQGEFASEFRVVWPDGSLHWVEARGWVDRDRQGAPTRLIGVNLDITDRKRAEEATEMRVLALEAAQLGAWDYMPDTDELVWDARTRALFGQTEPKVTLRCFVDRVHPSDRERIVSTVAAALGPDSDGSYDIEYRAFGEGDRVQWIRAAGKVLFSGEGSTRVPRRALGVVMDATARKRGEADLRWNESRARLALEGGQLGTWEMDATERGYCDPRAREIFGIPAGGHFELARASRVIHPDDCEASVAALRHAVRTGTRYEVEKRLVAPNGEIRWVRTWGLPLDDEAGESRFVGVVQDITKEKTTEEVLREADKRKNEYLAMLGHELRNPLASVRMAAELLASEVTSDIGQKATSALTRQTKQMSKLVDGLLDVSRITQGKLSMEPGEVELVSLLDDVISDRQSDVERAGLRLARYFALEAPVPLLGDAARLVQVFDNLLGNAIRFSEPGGVIELRVHDDDGFVVVIVRDTGIGFAPEFAEVMFEPFRQGTQDLARRAGGLGLGLSLCKGLVELHGGTVVGRSPGRGRGAEMVVRLPLGGPLGGRAPSSVRAEAEPVSAPRVLLVEDNEDAAEMMCMFLEARGHEVEWVATGRHALESARARAPDIVLCDLGLPDGMSGYDVARALRAEESTKGLRLVALSGYGRPEDRERALGAGFDVHLTKPADRDALISALTPAAR